MEATQPPSPNQNQKTKKEQKKLSREIERQLQDENLKVYHQLLWAEEHLARNR